MEKLVVTFTCEGKPSLLWNIDIQETWFCTRFVTLHNIPSQSQLPCCAPCTSHFLQGNKQTSTQNKCGNLNHDVTHYWGAFNYIYKDHARERIISITPKTELTQYITTHTSQIMQAHYIFHNFFFLIWISSGLFSKGRKVKRRLICKYYITCIVCLSNKLTTTCSHIFTIKLQLVYWKSMLATLA